MKISEDPIFKQQLIQKIHQREFSERTGIHCSDLLYCLNKQLLRRIKPLEIDEHEVLLFSLGWSTQRWLTGETKDEQERIVDGITVTCDELYQGIPWELKCTFQSGEKPVQENDSWFKQIMAQCYVHKRTEAYLTRLELMGNWKSIFGKKEEKSLPQNQKPTLHAFHLSFDPDELEANWLWLRRRARIFGTMLDTGKLIPSKMALPDNHEWECGYCPEKYKELCQDG